MVSSELLKILGVQDDTQAKMENAEVMTFAVVAAKARALDSKRDSEEYRI